MMRTCRVRRVYACMALLFCAAAATSSPARSGDTPTQHHILWSLQGKTNKVYLLGSLHLLKESEPLPAAIDSAYADAETLLMEIDMDDLDPAQMQQAVTDLALLPADQSLQQQLGAQTYERFAAKARALGAQPELLDRFQPWFAAITLVQLQLMKLGFDPAAEIGRAHV